MATLLDVPEGGIAVVRGVAGGGHRLRRRLLEMGLVPGTEVEVLSSGWGRVVVRFRGSTVAVGRGLARRIIVEVVNNADHPPSG